MNRQLKSLLSTIGILMILLSACAVQPAQGQNLVDAVAKLTNGEQVKNLMNSAVIPNDGVAVESNQDSREINALERAEALNTKGITQSNTETIVDPGTSVEIGQASQPGAVVEEPYSGETSEGALSPQEREAILDSVNLSPPIIENSDTPGSISGPAPGTESGPVELEKPVAPLTISDNPGRGIDSSSGGISWSWQALSEWLSTLFSSIFRQ